jgi:uncharacterized membrane protein YccF (DUF307 family)
MNFLGNIIWLIFGGLLAALGYIFAVCAFITIIEYLRDCSAQTGWTGPVAIWEKDHKYSHHPVVFHFFVISFGYYRVDCTGHCALHLLILFITIIGIPFAKQHLKLVELSLMPFGKQVV